MYLYWCNLILLNIPSINKTSWQQNKLMYVDWMTGYLQMSYIETMSDSIISGRHIVHHQQVCHYISRLPTEMNNLILKMFSKFKSLHATNVTEFSISPLNNCMEWISLPLGIISESVYMYVYVHVHYQVIVLDLFD